MQSSSTPGDTFDLGPPLVVDVDGTLIKTDLLSEGVAALVARAPWQVLRLPWELVRGRSALKAFVAREGGVGAESVPYTKEVLELIEQVRCEGRRIVLASGAHETQVAELGQRVGASMSVGSSEKVNLTGHAKLRYLRSQLPVFDYVGNGLADLPLWAAARRAYVVNPGVVTLYRARKVRPDLQMLGPYEPFRVLKAWVRALRLHHWAKNVLLLLPVLAAHLQWSPHLAASLLAGFVAFSLAASAAYVLNDLVDLPYDRLHPTKRCRPIAAGELSIPLALVTPALALAGAAVIAAQLRGSFQLVLAAYFAIATAYSLALKQVVLVDVFTLAVLYAMRVAAGATLVDVPLSRWFLAFSVFFFVSLALVKSVVELQDTPETIGRAPGRGYERGDSAILTPLGLAAAAASALVYCLYISADDVGRLYRHPDVLWVGLPMLLYWEARMWLLAARREMHDDPLVFALRDRRSYVALASFLVAVWAAA